MTRAKVDFYFDYLSGYAYFASLDVGALCARRDAELALHPVLFASLLNHGGQLGPAEIPAKRAYAYTDWLRLAQLRGIELRGPATHPFNPLHALRVSLRAVAGADQEKVVATLFRAAWTDGVDLGAKEEVRRALDAAGLDGTRLLAAAEEPAAKEALRAETEAAIAAGVFGVPTMISGGALFWGADRLGHLELFLEGRLTVDAAQLEAMLARPRGAERKR